MLNDECYQWYENELNIQQEYEMKNKENKTDIFRNLTNIFKQEILDCCIALNNLYKSKYGDGEIMAAILQALLNVIFGISIRVPVSLDDFKTICNKMCKDYEEALNHIKK